ncbi:uncharacterized protein HD556DRAFT_1313321 [Suillus plorans]|uniref:Uncharacterized protein n=1 Tax=Suillus plorans TaxID=116603 RepID=A0A9P7DAY7_9AGAM|nr:uncharacterized protein HD556DRAFT_1313321 [Suillus plorans]KAG1786698.1 hypothetical protein HD556DRAFT_1313321 [Suillus plorans]
MHTQGAPAPTPVTKFDPLANHPAASKVMAQQQPSRKPSSTFQPREREIIGTTYTWSSPNSEFNQRKASLVTRSQIQARVLWATISAPFNSLLTLHRPLFTVAVPLPALHEATLIQLHLERWGQYWVHPEQRHTHQHKVCPDSVFARSPTSNLTLQRASPLDHSPELPFYCPDCMLAGAKCFVSSRIQATTDIDLCNLAKLEAVMSVVEMAGSAPEGCEMWVREGPAVKRGWRRQKVTGVVRIAIRIVEIAIHTYVDRHPHSWDCHPHRCGSTSVISQICIHTVGIAFRTNVDPNLLIPATAVYITRKRRLCCDSLFRLPFMSLTGDTLFLWLAGLGFYMFDISFCASSLVWRYSCSWGVFIGATKFGMDLEYIDNHDSSTLRVNRLYGTSSTSACAGRVDGLEESG